jgi:hypothetical protein
MRRERPGSPSSTRLCRHRGKCTQISGNASGIDRPVRDSSAPTGTGLRQRTEAVVLELKEPAIARKGEAMRYAVAKICRPDRKTT